MSSPRSRSSPPGPIALGIALLRSKLDRKERLAAAWFGPKGFASVVYALLILEAGIPLSDELFHLAALVIAASILAHSSTDVLVARWFESEPDPDDPGHDATGRTEPRRADGSLGRLRRLIGSATPRD